MSSAACASLAVAANSPKSFGGARSQIVLKTSTEFELLNHTVSPTAQGASINFWWITGTPWEGGPSHGGSSGQAAGVDYAIWRFYLDGETTPSIELQTSQGAFVGNADPSAPWDNEWFGKNSRFGGWHSNVPIPFKKSARVTLQYPQWWHEGDNGSCEASSGYKSCVYAMVRGVEDLPVQIGEHVLPSDARLVASVRNSTLKALDFHELISVPAGTAGMMLGTMIDITMYEPSVKPSPPPPPHAPSCDAKDFIPDTDFWGGDLMNDRKQQPSAAACCAYCVSLPACTAWTWHPAHSPMMPLTCFPKNSATGRQLSQGNTSGIIAGRKPGPNPSQPPLVTLEGCWHAYSPPTAPFPGLLLGTGAEDYPESAYYFNAGPWRGPTSGLTVWDLGEENRIAFYKLHHRDPYFFQDGFKFMWRNGDITDPKTGQKCIAQTGTPAYGNPAHVNVTTLVYAYTWGTGAPHAGDEL